MLTLYINKLSVHCFRLKFDTPRNDAHGGSPRRSSRKVSLDFYVKDEAWLSSGNTNKIQEHFKNVMLVW